MDTINPITYPPRPINGGPLTTAEALSKWYYEPKYNGWRALVHTPTGTMFNRRGERLSIAGEFVAALQACQHLPWDWLDCEALERRHGIGRGTLILFDVPSMSVAWAAATYADRRDLMEEMIPSGSINILEYDERPQDNRLYLASCYHDPHFLWKELMVQNQKLGTTTPANYFYEGIVAKRWDSKYPIQLRNPEIEFPYWRKHRYDY